MRIPFELVSIYQLKKNTRSLALIVLKDAVTFLKYVPR